MAATCSTHGSTIRVFSMPNGEKLYTFQRESKLTEHQYLNFSKNNLYLMNSSDTGTIHIFAMDESVVGKSFLG